MVDKRVIETVLIYELRVIFCKENIMIILVPNSRNNSGVIFSKGLKNIWANK